MKPARRVGAGLVVLAAILGASLNAAAEPRETITQAIQPRTTPLLRDLTATVQGPTRVALTWQGPEAAETLPVTGYGIQFSDDGGANWTVLPTVDHRTTSFVHTVGVRPDTEIRYRVFSLTGEGAGPAAVVSATTPAIAMPRIVHVRFGTDEGTSRWYPPRREVVVTVQFDQAVTVNTQYGAPQVMLKMGRPPHRQSGYASDYSGGSGTDQLTFRYPADWHQDLRDIEVSPDALYRNGARITNVLASHSASLAHGPAVPESTPQVGARFDAFLVHDGPEPAPAAELPVARTERSGGPDFAAMLTAAAALVAGTGIVQELALTERFEEAPPIRSERPPGASMRDPDESSVAVAADLGRGGGPLVAVTASAPLLWSPHVGGQTTAFLFWGGSTGGTITGYLIEYSDDDGMKWKNLLGTDEQGDDIYHPASPRSYLDNTLTAGATWKPAG